MTIHIKWKSSRKIKGLLIGLFMHYPLNLRSLSIDINFVLNKSHFDFLSLFFCDDDVNTYWMPSGLLLKE